MKPKIVRINPRNGYIYVTLSCGETHCVTRHDVHCFAMCPSECRLYYYCITHVHPALSDLQRKCRSEP